MTDKTKEPKENSTREKLEGIAQVVIGEIESLGGVITGDPVTSAEGDFNVQVGTLHQESAGALAKPEKHEKSESSKTDDSRQTETAE